MANGAAKPSPIEVAQTLGGIDFPASKEDIIEKAADNQAGDELIELLRRIPDQDYESMAEVMQGFGQVQ